MPKVKISAFCGLRKWLCVRVCASVCVCVLPSSTSPSRLLENGLSKLIQIGSIPKTYNPPNIKSPIIGVKSMWKDVASNLRWCFKAHPLPESRASSKRWQISSYLLQYLCSGISVLTSSNWVCPKMGYPTIWCNKNIRVPMKTTLW